MSGRHAIALLLSLMLASCGSDETKPPGPTPDGGVEADVGVEPPDRDSGVSSDMADLVECGPTEVLVGGECTCPPGTEGDGQGGCDPNYCSEDEYVLGNACTVCPPGQTRPAGDDPTGADTMCAATDPCVAAVGVACTEFDEAYLKASNSQAGDGFGVAVAVDGDTLAVAAWKEESGARGIDGEQTDDSAKYSGAVYVFVRSGSTWSQQAYLKASNSAAFDQFGMALSLDGDTLAVSAMGEDSSATGIDGDESDNGADYSGAVYVFQRSAGEWSQDAYIKASNTRAGAKFGNSVSVDGDTLVVGSRSEWSGATGVGGDQFDATAQNAGAAYVFVRSAGMWAQQAYIKASNTGSGDEFGQVVAVDGDTLAVSAHREDSASSGIGGEQASDDLGEAGAVYLFRRTGSNWSQEAYIKASNPDLGDLFGQALALDGDTLVVTTPFERSAATGVDGDQSDNSADYAGAAYVFTREGADWTQQAYVKPSNTRSAYFGSCVALEGDNLVVAAVREASAATGVNGDEADDSAYQAGAVYLFRRSGNDWAQSAYIKASNAEAGDSFGGFGGVALAGDTLAVGAEGESSAAVGVNGEQADNAAADAGAVYVRRIAP